MDKFCFSPDLFDLTKHKVSCCRAVWLHRMTYHMMCYYQTNDWNVVIVGPEQERTSVVCKDERDVYVLTYGLCKLHQQEKVTCVECGNALNPQLVQDCNQHIGYINKDDRMTSSFLIQQWTWKCIKIFYPIWYT